MPLTTTTMNQGELFKAKAILKSLKLGRTQIVSGMDSAIKDLESNIKEAEQQMSQHTIDELMIG